MKKREAELLNSILANLIVLRDSIEELRETKPLFQKAKMYSNLLEPEILKLINIGYRNSGTKDEVIYEKFEVFAKEYTQVLIDGKADILIMLMKAMKEGNVSAVEDGKHGKFLAQNVVKI